MWGMMLQFCQDARKQGVKIGLFAQQKAPLPAGSFCRCTYSLECVGADDSSLVKPSGVSMAHFKGRSGYGKRDFFGLGIMSGGFDKTAWADKGLPAYGSVVLRLTVKDVGV